MEFIFDIERSSVAAKVPLNRLTGPDLAYYAPLKRCTQGRLALPDTQSVAEGLYIIVSLYHYTVYQSLCSIEELTQHTCIQELVQSAGTQTGQSTSHGMAPSTAHRSNEEITQRSP